MVIKDDLQKNFAKIHNWIAQNPTLSLHERHLILHLSTLHEKDTRFSLYKFTKLHGDKNAYYHAEKDLVKRRYLSRSEGNDNITYTIHWDFIETEYQAWKSNPSKFQKQKKSKTSLHMENTSHRTENIPNGRLVTVQGTTSLHTENTSSPYGDELVTVQGNVYKTEDIYKTNKTVKTENFAPEIQKPETIKSEIKTSGINENEIIEMFLNNNKEEKLIEYSKMGLMSFVNETEEFFNLLQNEELAYSIQVKIFSRIQSLYSIKEIKKKEIFNPELQKEEISNPVLIKKEIIKRELTQYDDEYWIK
jgi:hypothetical protein